MFYTDSCGEWSHISVHFIGSLQGNASWSEAFSVCGFRITPREELWDCSSSNQYMKTSPCGLVFTAYFKYSEFYMSKINHPDLLLPWSHCEDYLTWMSLEGKILICKFYFHGILQFLPLLREFSSWSFFPRYCSLLPGFKREEVSPSKRLHFYSSLDKNWVK